MEFKSLVDASDLCKNVTLCGACPYPVVGYDGNEGRPAMVNTSQGSDQVF